MVKIYTARSVLEASMIRRALESHGLECLIPGEDFDAAPGNGLEENAIFVPAGERDRAIGLLKETWEFFDSSYDSND
jgi:hypothetical protein